ncbi:MAG: hypothetical protein JRI47_07635 [Deltaproteobacteria bacterium]|nr:hypothetical protein [Deltaproteobacteria bacterium]
MSTKLDRLLESIDPSRTLDQVSTRVDQAVNSFAMEQATIEDWNEYESFLAEFYRHIENVVLRIGPGGPSDKEFYWGRCSKLLNKAFGTSGYKAAFEMVRTGEEGGLYSVLKNVADLMAEQYAQNEISARISNYWNNLSLDEKLAAPDEYLGNYGHLLPAELTEGNATTLRLNFIRVLEEHPKMIHRMRRIDK